MLGCVSLEALYKQAWLWTCGVRLSISCYVALSEAGLLVVVSREASQIYVADLKANHVAYVHTLRTWFNAINDEDSTGRYGPTQGKSSYIFPSNLPRSLASLYQSVGQVHMVQPLLLEVGLQLLCFGMFWDFWEVAITLEAK